MGRLIDCNAVYNAIQITTDNFGVAKKVVEDNMLTMLLEIETVEAIPKDQYETRLKADKVAMLTELQLEIEECVDGGEGSPQFEQGVTNARVQVVEIIQQKINKLKAESEGT